MALSDEQRAAIRTVADIPADDAADAANELQKLQKPRGVYHAIHRRGTVAEREEKDRWKARAETAQQEAAELRGKVPDDGSVVLKGKDAEAWTALKALGTPEQIQAGLTERDDAKAKLAARDRADGIRAAAEAAGYRPKVLERLLGESKATLEVKTEKGEKGEDVAVAYITPEGGKATKLEEYAASADSGWADFLPALTAEAAPKGGEGDKATHGGFWPAQKGEGGGGKEKGGKSVVDALIERNQERARAPNALRPAKGGN